VNEVVYTVDWTSAARRSLPKLPEKVATAAIEFIYGSLSENPHRVGKALQLSLAGQHSARRGDYRVIYRIDEGDHRIVILLIRHRSDAYPARRN